MKVPSILSIGYDIMQEEISFSLHIFTVPGSESVT